MIRTSLIAMLGGHRGICFRYCGAALRSGETLGLLSSSGNSTEPHLHFQICDGPEIAECRPIPANFVDYRLPFELAPRSIQSGDIVETIR